MPNSKKVGVSDIAKHAGVSIGTVSNYLNYPERVSATLKTRISRAIADLGYVPKHSGGQIPASNTTPVIGFVMTDIEHSLFTSIFEGVQEVCEDHGMQVVGLNALSDKQRQSDMVRLLIGMNVTGILLSTVEDSPEDVAAARAAGIPIILIDHTNPRDADPVCSVMSDNVSAGQMAAEELIRTGCTRLAFLAHSFDYESVQDRQLGVQKAVMLAGRNGGDARISSGVIDSGGLYVEDGYESGLAIATMPEGERPDGIVTVDTPLGVGVINALLAQGVRIPEDISVIACEEAQVKPLGSLPLTSVAANATDIGRKAMTQMLDHMDDADAHVHVTALIKPTLIRRTSTRR
ncbi:LacI family DNA-binding transcriptional regulator [Bifidobacterium moukalabense]|uniref:LacI family DNA-binding transcriptional regulator n=1 Tax=Bifidobacterium moukalabense TaxID=1333651 RepID=UPI0010F5410E|nr:LacI family DNA-binding transcriptional regulator [Bifidobacterium moukalabense]